MPFAFVLDDAKEDDEEEEEERNAQEEEHVEDIIASRDAIIVGSSRARRAAFLFLPSLSLSRSLFSDVRVWLKSSRGSQQI